MAVVGGRAQYVGGAVRDALLGRAADEVDVEVFGVDPEALRHLVERIAPVSLVGASFGVLKVHGLAVDVSVPRRERKAGTGHRGFEVDADPGLDVRSAAARRDFTVNAIAWDPLSLELIDPFDGAGDLERRLLRHTSDRFAEDPLRVLRGMQFIARFALRPHPGTVALCRTIEDEGLAAERVFDEWSKLLLRGTAISAGLAFLADCGWLRYVPELEALVGCPQDPEWHPEGDVWVHTGHVMDQFAAARRGEEWEDLVVGFGCLCHDLGKPATTVWKDGRWRSPGHEDAGVAPTRSLLGRMTNHARLAEEVVPLVADHLKPDQLYLGGASPAAVRRLARRVGRLDRLLRVAWADRRGRPPAVVGDFPAAEWLERTARELDVVDQPPKPLVMGRHLIALGLEPGPRFKPLLDAAFEAQLDGRVTTLEEGLAYVRGRLEGPAPG
ncbi:MAG: polynucleotide adenylyltransferase [Acidimicrobiia bacterium]|nr:polynucleotide adenylyltransferase [Acidimicrobiia bacterium]